MEHRILTLRYSLELGTIDDAPLLALAREQEILTVREHFFVAQDLPHLLCIVSCRSRATIRATARPSPEVATEVTEHPQPRSSPAPDLSPDQRRLFDAIRRWRAEQAERAGVPRYVVLTNRNIEALVRSRPDSTAALRRIPGIGTAKITQYGDALLELLHPRGPAPCLVPAPQEEAAEP